ncbi:MAG TPA: TlpA disulfide reductase family protein [Steroidobacteraceae bacterium]
MNALSYLSERLQWLPTALFAGVLLSMADVTPASADDVSTALSVRLLDLGGKVHQLAEWKGQLVLVNYWATWCVPCLKEIPELDAFSVAQSKRKLGIHVVGVALDEPDAVRTFLKRGVTYPVLVESAQPGEGSSALLGNKQGVLPYSVLLDAQGRVLRTKFGSVTAADLTAWAKQPQP